MQIEKVIFCYLRRNSPYYYVFIAVKIIHSMDLTYEKHICEFLK